MNYKKRIIILSIFLILTIQVLLFINNRQKTSFRYFIWQVEEVSIGKLICISFISGLLMSSLLNKSLNNDTRAYLKNKDDHQTTNTNDYSSSGEEINASNEIPPERDLRDTQPTISVNYRIIKENVENELNDRNQKSKKSQYQDDWYENDSEW